MKKILAIVLALVMVLGLVACAGGGSTEPAASTSPAASNEPAAEGTVGWYTDPVDHYARDPYDICYIMMNSSAINASFSHGFEVWSTRLNYNYSDFSANQETDTFINTLETLAVQGMDGFIIDFSDEIRSRLLDILPELDIPYMSGMVSAYDDDGKLAHPSLGFDMRDFGVQEYYYIVDAAQKKWGPDLDLSKCGFLYVDFGAVWEIAQRQQGFHDTLEAEHPELMDNYFVADTVAQGGMTAQNAYDEAAPIVAAHPEFEYWIVAGAIDDFGQGAARIFESSGKEDKAVVTTIGGDTLITEWDAGYEGCWISAYYTAQMIYCEGIICGLIALIDGRATPETLWAEHIPEGEKYAEIDIPSVFIEHDNYTEYMEWVDAYTGYDWSHYDYKGTDFSYTLNFR